MGDVMFAIGVLAAGAALVLGIRFSEITLLLFTVAVAIVFAASVLGGSSSVVVGLQMLATLASVQISYIVGCLLAAHLRVPIHITSGAPRQQDQSGNGVGYPVALPL